MNTFNVNDRVWYRRHLHSARLPATVVRVGVLPGLYDVRLADSDVVVACTEQLSHRSDNDRVEGLGQLRARMHREAAEQIRQDADLPPEELREKYDEGWGWGQPPGTHLRSLEGVGGGWADPGWVLGMGQLRTE